VFKYFLLQNYFSINNFIYVLLSALFMPEEIQKPPLNLEARFAELCELIGLKNPQYVFGIIRKFHTRPGRYHHNLALVRRGLEEFSAARRLAKDPKAVEIALFFKDLIFEHYLSDNKPRSAKIALHHLRGYGVERDTAYYIHDLVLTADPAYRYSDDPGRSPQTIDQKIVSDIDSSVLGLPPAEYDEYERNIRKEYLSAVHKEVSEDQYMMYRIIFLQRFLGKHPVYLTRFFRKKYEKQAKKNIEGRLAELRKQLNDED
jgi:predicted metal-dependent HD superfamily phosphohydrolase